ncbi:type VI secretion system ATPase TssH [Pseudomonas guariconensis]|uniref:type VI secretion system ATPase TssH n=1 Tax=Pseudomonas guariconensis TaxID=1288410 RepID=UPI0018D6B385|nr:type VI secretion system ATPase TssH [Pseudomonas guariconensis]MBH3359913.1 type VI secretion system ATPase TssH [Pseudomonas guariconensis]
MHDTLRSRVASLSIEARKALDEAALRASEAGHFEITCDHFLFALIGQQPRLAEGLSRHCGLDLQALQVELKRRLQDQPDGNAQSVVFSESLVGVLDDAWERACLQWGHSSIGVACCWASWFEQSGSHHPEVASLRAWLTCDASAAVAWLCTQGHGQPTSGQEVGALKAYGHNLTQQAREQRLDPVIGREKEVRQVIDVLLRRRQNNPLLVGEPGVGKTALVEGVAQRIAAGDVPQVLKNCEVYSLDLGLLQAGASVKGEFEKRLQSVVEEAAASPVPVVLFIDEAHRLQGAGGMAGQNDAANMLKPALSRGQLQVIAATTWAEYKSIFEKDAALARRFQLIKVEPPSETSAIAMLRHVAPLLERHHGVTILHEAIEAAVRLSTRYIIDRQLPDKSLALLDTACARVALSQTHVPHALEDLDAQLASLGSHRDWLAREKREVRLLEELVNTQARLQRAREDVYQQWQQQRAWVQETLAGLPAGDAASRSLAEAHEQQVMVHAHVDAMCVAHVLSGWTGIPLGKLKERTQASETTLLGQLQTYVAGQEPALKALARKLFITRAGLQAPDKPAGVFMLAGPSGVGKTETALALAQVYGSGPESLITLNMSEYQEAHTVSALKGAPAGYVGYGKGGRLTEAVRKRPHCVLLLDEFEKAHPDVREMFYQVLDKGWMEDAEGQRVSFHDAWVVMTTNVGSELLTECRADDEVMSHVRQACAQVFKPVFMGRVNLQVYQPLCLEQLMAIARLKLDKIVDRVGEASRGYMQLVVKPAIVKAIATACRVSESGAREIDELIDEHVLPELARVVAAEQGKTGVLTLSFSKNRYQCQWKNLSAVEA